jgi:predicted nucleotidyltransferase
MIKSKANRRQVQRKNSLVPRQLWHPDVPGPLWNGTHRVKLSQIRAYCRVVAREFQPRKIILFGSYATGSATPDSDVDLVVVLNFRGSTTDKVVEIRGRVEAPFPMDLLLWKPSGAGKEDAFTRSVLSEGKVMYETGPRRHSERCAGGSESLSIHTR